MTAMRLIRWSGFVMILTGVLLLLLGILPSIVLPTGDSILNGVLDPQWGVVSVLAFVLTILMVWTLISLYSRQINESGFLGILGFSMSFLGLLLYSGLQFDMAFVWPSLAIHAPALIDYSGPMFTHPMFSVIHFLFVLVTPLGYLIFGISMIRAKVFPRWSAILFTLGMPLASGILFPPFILRTIGGVLSAGSLIWMGTVLLNEKDQSIKGI